MEKMEEIVEVRKNKAEKLKGILQRDYENGDISEGSYVALTNNISMILAQYLTLEGFEEMIQDTVSYYNYVKAKKAA